MKRTFDLIIMCILLALMTAGCAASEENTGADAVEPGSTQSAGKIETESDESANPLDTESAGNDAGEEITEMKMTINGTPVSVSWENNESVRALAEMAETGSVTIKTEPYGGFEQVGSIGATLPSNDTDIRTNSGDIMLYSGSQMVVFYGSNSWAYTRLGKITDKSDSELRELLGGDGVTVNITSE
jgi:hypothetical protein